MGRSAADTPTPAPRPAPRSLLARQGGVAALGVLLAASLAAPWAHAGQGPVGEPAAGQFEVEGTKPEEAQQPSALEHTLDSHELHLPFGIHLRLWPEAWDNPYFTFTRFKLYMLLAALIVLLVYVPVAKRVYTGETPRGWWDNMFESVLTFLRDRVVKPNIGEKDADKYVPFLWTLFLFILVSNLLGLIPFGGSPTASISVTLALAFCVFFAIHGAATAKMGFGHYIGSLWPHIDVPIVLKILIAPLVFCIEVMGVVVRNVVLAVRLFANMFAGHMVLATILLFIYTAANSGPALWGTVTVGSVVGLVLLNLLELFVAFLQAFIFVFLTALFMGLALHPHI
jgi:F-type H+-transporting ATPase subunit a